MTPPRPLPEGRQVWRVGHTSLVISPRLVTITVVLLVVGAALGVTAMTLGTLRLSFGEVIAAVVDTSGNAQHDRVVRSLRLPRVVTAIFAGAALGVSGAIFQSVSRNALGSPDVIGFTTGAATGAIVQIVVFQADALQVSLGAVAGGLLTAAVVYLLSRRAGVTGGYRLILTGIGVSAVLGAVNGLLLVTGDLDQAFTANLWLSGSLDARSWTHALPVTVGVLVVVPLVLPLARRASLIEMGDDLAQQLGVRVERTRVLLMLAAVALAGLATGAAGPIAFIALAAPQLVVRLTGWRRMPVVSAAAMGGCLLMLADTVTRLLPITAAVPIGRVTGIIGGLYLIWMLTRAKQV
ncbi:FecCD family ABC transporter permease [Salinispora fenicalii]|uniref:FecCD family ABC transporter permease n=1 Tax=Salinispora fenicalii TaxID=1137263 RepID=UPI000475DEFC|nr:iron chelate uptake ABC transporter family permease subunit [Salinispora fenicalii]